MKRDHGEDKEIEERERDRGSALVATIDHEQGPSLSIAADRPRMSL